MIILSNKETSRFTTGGSTRNKNCFLLIAKHLVKHHIGENGRPLPGNSHIIARVYPNIQNVIVQQNVHGLCRPIPTGFVAQASEGSKPGCADGRFC